ncbi:hypothetical protein MTR_1g030330 [Medicago truncatula]|uniref:Uncharacterized protein n=1 Tax=Medicago truncatula TaxID=3880 RepID=G7I8F5_MEDTR|nr:hypothetical protein MTR_1g030330 [Medicago truncatula]
MEVSIINQKNIDASIKNLEVEMGQLVKQLASNHKGTLTANTKHNPKEQCNAINVKRKEKNVHCDG